MAFSGFPQGTRYTPVPNPLFGPLLEAIDDVTELKCTLRAIWLLHHKKGYPRFLPAEELLSDPVLLSSLKSSNGHSGEAILAALDRAVGRGTFLTANIGPPGKEELVYLLNTEANRKATLKLASLIQQDADGRLSRGGERQPPPQRPGIFALYEENVGMVTPLLADELREAEESYPASWVEEAFKLAVEHNRRRWSYIRGILERWANEGKDDGEPGRHPQKDNRQRYLKDYLRRRGPLSRG